MSPGTNWCPSRTPISRGLSTWKRSSSASWVFFWLLALTRTSTITRIGMEELGGINTIAIQISPSLGRIRDLPWILVNYRRVGCDVRDSKNAARRTEVEGRTVLHQESCLQRPPHFRNGIRIVPESTRWSIQGPPQVHRKPRSKRSFRMNRSTTAERPYRQLTQGESSPRPHSVEAMWPL